MRCSAEPDLPRLHADPDDQHPDVACYFAVVGHHASGTSRAGRSPRYCQCAHHRTAASPWSNFAAVQACGTSADTDSSWLLASVRTDRRFESFRGASPMLSSAVGIAASTTIATAYGAAAA